MKHFWQGFVKQGSSAPAVQFKKHIILVFWSPDDEKGTALKRQTKRVALKYPSVKLRSVNVKKEPTSPIKHNVGKLPTVLLLKDGREVQRLVDADSETLLEHIFKKAHV